MEIAREGFEQTVELGAVAELKGIHEDKAALRPENAGEFGGDLQAHVGGNLVEEIDGGEEIETPIGKGHGLGDAGMELGLIRRHMAAGFLHIGRGEIEAHDPQAREGLLEEADEAAGAAGDIEKSEAALIAAAQILRHRHDALPAHGVGGAREEDLDLGVIEAGGVRREIAACLIVEVLQEIVRKLTAEGGIIDLARRRRLLRSAARGMSAKKSRLKLKTSAKLPS